MLRGLLLFFFTLSLQAADISRLSPLSPTSFENEISLEPFTFENSDSMGPSLSIKNHGSLGKTKTIVVRASQPQDTAIFLEGIRLNSPSMGAFDFGDLSVVGISSARITRGGYSLLSSQPNGSVNLSLPNEEKYLFQTAYGSYDFYGFGIQVPHIALSIEQGNFDFPYEANGREGTWENNFSQRINLRTWARTKEQQAWIQVLYVDQGSPGSLNFLTPQAEMQTLSPTLAYQAKYKKFGFHTWINHKNQIYKDPSWSFKSENQWINIGHRTESVFSVSPIQIPMSIEWTLDKLWITQNSSGTRTTILVPWRNTVSLSTGILWSPVDEILIHPRVRTEWLSDLRKENFSFHPGLGIKYNANKNLMFLTNIAWISRAPDFNDMYFDIPFQAEKNPDLKRQSSLQSDIGFIFSSKFIQLEQSLFIDRTSRILQSEMIPTSSNNVIFKVFNRGVALTYGWESKMVYQTNDQFSTTASYTLQRSRLSDETRQYQPTHRAEIKETYLATKDLEFKVPFSYRSRVKAGRSSIGHQFDLSVEALYRWKKLTLKAEGKNLLFWNREEVLGYPLGNEAAYQISLQAEF